MNWEVPVQPAGQAGAPGKTAGDGLEVGVLRSSNEAPVMGVERRRDTCPNVRSDRGRWPRKGIRRYDAHVINPDFSSRGKPWGRIGLGKPDTLCGQLGYVVPSPKTVDSLGFSYSPHHIMFFIYRLLRKPSRPFSFERLLAACTSGASQRAKALAFIFRSLSA